MLFAVKLLILKVLNMFLKLAKFNPSHLLAGCCLQSEFLNSTGFEYVSENYKVLSFSLGSWMLLAA